MARDGKTKFEAYIDDIIAIPFKNKLSQDIEYKKGFTQWLEVQQRKYLKKYEKK